MQYFRLNLCVSLAGQINFVVLRSISILMGNEQEAKRSVHIRNLQISVSKTNIPMSGVAYLSI